MKRIVLDTNVLVSGMINPHGAPGRIVDLIREGQVHLVVDDRILAEYRDVLRRPRFRRYFSLQDVRDIMVFLERNTTYLVPTQSVAGLPDADDVPFLELALAAKVPLVTGNADDFPKSLCQSVTVTTPTDYLKQWIAAPER
jgi:uncharacterized protein